MIEINHWLGGALLLTLGTMAFGYGMIMWSMKRLAEQSEWWREYLEKTRKNFRMVFVPLCGITVVFFVLAFLWTGWHISTTEEAGSLKIDKRQTPYAPGLNSETSREQRRDEGSTLQQKGQADLDAWRNQFMEKQGEDK